MTTKIEKQKIEDKYINEYTPYDDLLKIEVMRVTQLRCILADAEEGIVHWTDEIEKWKREKNSN